MTAVPVGAACYFCLGEEEDEEQSPDMHIYRAWHSTPNKSAKPRVIETLMPFRRHG